MPAKQFNFVNLKTFQKDLIEKKNYFASIHQGFHPNSKKN